jgi:hypothetical protein
MRFALLAVASLLAVACAPAPAPQAPPPQGPYQAPAPHPYTPYPTQPAQPMPGGLVPQPSNPDQAQADLTRAEQELEADLGGTGPAELGVTKCQRLCRSLASMRRAVASVCELAGESDDRCEGARDRLRNNERRVAEAGCTC